MNQSQSNGAVLLIMAMGFLMLPGLVVNNLKNDNILNTSTAMTCSSDPTNPVCTLNAVVGCQSSSAFCNLSGSSISFLNGASPFTQALQGNVFALFTNLNGQSYSGPGAQSSWGGSHGPFDVAQGGNFFQVNAYGQPAGGASRAQTNWGILSLTQANTDNSNTTEANAARWNNWNTAQSGVSKLTPFFHITGNASGTTAAFYCNYLAQINYTALSDGPGFTYFGCDLLVPTGASGTITTPTWSILIAMPVNLGSLPAGNSHQFLYAQLENWDTLECAGAQSASASVRDFNSAACQSFINSFKGIAIPGSTSNFVPGYGGPMVGFLAGLVLFIGGLGLQFGLGGGVAIGINAQGTKLMQAIGLGLIGWSFFFTEFSVWFTSGYLPYGLDGVVGIVSIAIGAMWFIGVYLISQTGAGPSGGSMPA